MDKSKERVAEILIKGRNSAKMLQNLLRRKVDNDGSVSVDNIVMEIMGSFVDSLSVLNSFHTGKFCRVPVSPHMGLACSLDRVLEFCSEETGKNLTLGVRKRRGSYKRRTIDSRVKTSCTIEDGYSWRKYGQKEILNSKFPRCYFRCTHKHVLGCKALKQVQKLEDETNMLHITYFGYHTCSPSNTFSHHGGVLDRKNSKIYHNLLDNPLTITNVQINPSLEKDPSSPKDTESLTTLVWKEIMINDLECFKNYGILSDIPFANVFIS
ncbi:unnamed protein product [Lactuca virosa]|uniref:WRKY domain-containing protein n=1 Tax=Lactuca virosa TaxID=75947 RepID=A0AAU9NLS6_9ASTR|nr:unnamed protein product [Lactuca virosa]